MTFNEFSRSFFSRNGKVYKTLRRFYKRAQRSLNDMRHWLNLWSYFFVNVDKSDLVIVTGADSSHYKSLLQFLSSLERHEPEIKTVIFDLGLKTSERLNISKSFPNADLRIFDYSNYPPYFDIRSNAGEYAWKPVIVHDILHEFRSCICWMDAGNLVTEPLTWIRKITVKGGFYSPISAGRISDWTHPKTLEYLGASNELLDRRNLSGACVAVSFDSTIARQLISDWRDGALNKDCIAPVGSSRQNHRQDQAVLSVLAYKSGITRNLPTGIHGIRFHNDID